MKQYNPKNERIKHEYFQYQREAGRKSESTLAGIRKAIDRFEEYTGYKDFATFNQEQGVAFKKNLMTKTIGKSGQPIGKATVLTTMNILKTFFRWLAYQPGYKSRIHIPDIEYLNLSEKDVSIAKAVKHKTAPTLEQVKRVILSMPSGTEIERRDRAVIAFAILTGMRDSALATLRLKHVDLSCDPIMVKQEPDLVKTKFSKQIISYFLPIGDEEIKKIAVGWIKELREQKLYGEDAPVFPKTKLVHDENQSFVPAGLDPVCWRTATPIRKIFREAFEAVGLPYFNPHLLRHTLARFGQEICKTPEQFKAWSQCFGHSTPLTTFTSYGNLDPYRQGEVIRELAQKKEEENTVAAIFKELQRMQQK